MAIAYRREIDGLRAIAVSAVVIYHAGFAPAAGYVGVDIFFVISGYLITALLLREQARSGRIDFADFYARRVRRIFPASMAVILAVLFASTLLPQPQAIAASAAAASLFVANIFFQLQTGGYFHADASQMPLLHLWSLSVEEQFYLAWPLLLVGLLRLRLRLSWCLAALALASFLLCEWLMQANPSAAFYQTPARFWELAAGGLVAALPVRKLPGWLTWAGLGLTLAACFLKLPHFPGWGALPAVAGTALLLAAIHGGAGNALLASRPFVGIGLISYSLYLWHWPLLAFDRLLRVGPAPLEARLVLVAVALLLAFGSYRYIETPLRRPWASSRRTVVAGFATMALLTCGAWAWASREPAQPATVVYRLRCTPEAPRAVQAPTCLGKEPKVVIWGDSYAIAWEPMAVALATHLDVPVTTFARTGCPPLLGAQLALRAPYEAARCREWNAKAIAYLRDNGADTLVLVARWQNFIEADGGASSARGLLNSVAAASPHVRRILIIGPTPEFSDTPKKCAALGADCSIPRAGYLAHAAPSWRALRAIRDPKVTLTDPAAWLCDAQRCPNIRDGMMLYSDEFHVSPVMTSAWAKRVASDWN